MTTPLFFYSPFSAEALHKKEHHALFLQFVLSAILQAHALIESKQFHALYNPHPAILPFDLNKMGSPLNKLEEYALLLPHLSEGHAHTFHAYLQEAIHASHANILSYLRQLFTTVEPLLMAEKESENMLYFILKEHKQIDALFACKHTQQLLMALFPAGFLPLCAYLTKEFEKRGFSNLACNTHALISGFSNE